MTYLFGSALERILKHHPGLRVVSYNNDNPFQDGRGWRIWRHYFRTARLSHVNFVCRPTDIPLAQRMGLPNPQVCFPAMSRGFIGLLERSLRTSGTTSCSWDTMNPTGGWKP